MDLDLLKQELWWWIWFLNQKRIRKSYDHLSRGISFLAEALDMQPPVMPEDGHTTRVTSGEEVLSPVSSKDSSALEALWDDEDTKAFYECLPDLRAFVPAVLLGEAEPKLIEQSPKTQELPTIFVIIQNANCFIVVLMDWLLLKVEFHLQIQTQKYIVSFWVVLVGKFGSIKFW